MLLSSGDLERLLRSISSHPDESVSGIPSEVERRFGLFYATFPWGDSFFLPRAASPDISPID
jgi:hypothetical protein